LKVKQRFGGPYRLHLQVWRISRWQAERLASRNIGLYAKREGNGRMGPSTLIRTQILPSPGTHQPPPWCLVLPRPPPPHACVSLHVCLLHVASLPSTPLHFFFCIFPRPGKPPFSGP
jgi:hypothetical protein